MSLTTQFQHPAQNYVISSISYKQIDVETSQHVPFGRQNGRLKVNVKLSLYVPYGGIADIFLDFGTRSR